jgi:O-antigen ligase
LIGAVIVWGPWSFGCTTPWAIYVQNVLGYALGGLLLLKLAIRSWRPAAWRERSLRRTGWDTALVWVSALLLLYMLVSAWNARVVIDPATWQLAYRECFYWLPHSLDQESSWRAFALYLGLAGFFWAVRDWILHPAPHSLGSGCPPGQVRGTRETPPASSRHDVGAQGVTAQAAADYPRLPRRIRILLWILSVNAALVAIQGIAQRVGGSHELLWLLEPRINKDPSTFFGPYAYRANAAQYFNLVWPVALGLWWTYRQAGRSRSAQSPRREHSHLLLSCVLLIAICPLVSTSRGGAIVMGGLVILALAVLGSASWRGALSVKLALLGLLAGSVGLGVLLGWEELGPRMELLEQGYEQRETMFDTGRRMAADAPFFGTGPGSFRNLFPFYLRAPDEYWPAQMHNDWLETRITFGSVGLGLLLLALGLAAGRWLGTGGLPAGRQFVWLTWCALGGCLVHARFDFPFQIASIVAVFLLLCAVLSCLARPRGDAGTRRRGDAEERQPLCPAR